MISIPKLAWQVALENTKVNLDHLTDIYLLLMVEKGIRDGICYTISRYVKAKNKYMKNYDKIKNHHIKYWDINNLYGWAMSQKLLVNDFKWVEETFRFNEDFIRIYNEDSGIRYFIEACVQYPENVRNM